jgi:hypothetical protein
MNKVAIVNVNCEMLVFGLIPALDWEMQWDAYVAW